MSSAVKPFLIKVTNGAWSRTLRTQKPIHEVSKLSAFVAIKKDFPASRCPNCRGKIHGSHLVCLHETEAFSFLQQDIILALLDDKLLSYRSSFCFTAVLDVALFLALEEHYFLQQIGTYALLENESQYHPTK